MKLLTFIPLEEIEEMERTLSGEKLNPAKERLAYELTQMVHGKEEADKHLLLHVQSSRLVLTPRICRFRRFRPLRSKARSAC